MFVTSHLFLCIFPCYPVFSIGKSPLPLVEPIWMAEPKTADPAVIGAWLGLPHGPWPPDHYTLLGLPRGETDTGRIERLAQQRMETVRRYQLANPEMATEALNRLAQAFVCLTDTKAKAAYDHQLLGKN